MRFWTRYDKFVLYCLQPTVLMNRFKNVTLFFILYFQIALLYMSSRLMVNISQVYIPMYVTETLNLDKVRFYLELHIKIPLIVYAGLKLSNKAVPLYVATAHWSKRKDKLENRLQLLQPKLPCSTVASKYPTVVWNDYLLILGPKSHV